MGGEKGFCIQCIARMVGSPPRGRGKVLVHCVFLPVLRITPAWAGKRPAVDANKNIQEDHPRVGGEKTTDRPQGQAPAGSPPRGRGKEFQPVLCCRTPRITPAWAGKSRWRFSGRLWSWDHPRVGGEKPANAEGRLPWPGSPPRGRGKVGAGYADKGRPGITPAWAGKRLGRAGPCPCDQDHPRVGGEKTAGSRQRQRTNGSPPRGRGKVVVLPSVW